LAEHQAAVWPPLKRLGNFALQRGGNVMSNNTGNNNPGNFANDREKASEAGKKGGQSSGGNFANDREKASEAGRKGGQSSHGGGRQ
jgi:general stress protein YciG